MSAKRNSIINLGAFIAAIFIGVALILTQVGFADNISNTLEQLATALAFIVVLVCSYVYAEYQWRRKSKKNGVWYIVAWAVAVVLIVLFYILPRI